MKGEKIVVVEERAGIPAGMRLRLSEKQAAVRMQNLKQIEKDVYEALKPLEFKRGEEFEIITGENAPEPSKALLAQVLPPEKVAEKIAAGKKGKVEKKPAAPKETEKKDERPPVPGQGILDPTA
jgi:hypothetical protein